ncbi:PepSY domain-containing protein [Limibacter armeniacum]|uniref:PepSY domain-containing protein n=1 Tax=Limibacter armeniacum TaxID=466084 RepID=UPI002FE6B0E4
MRRKTHLFIRKSHRYLGILIGIQFFFWTLGGLYFSWSNLDAIHGDHFRKPKVTPPAIDAAILANMVNTTLKVQQLETRKFNGKLYLWVNKQQLIDPITWTDKGPITKDEAVAIAKENVLDAYSIDSVSYITETSKHSEYRGRPLPAWVIHYAGNDHLKGYISTKDGRFHMARHNDWRVFDFLWMLHTMDYEGRDNINNWLLRFFSVLGMLTIISGFALYFYTSKTFRSKTRNSKKLQKAF